MKAQKSPDSQKLSLPELTQAERAALAREITRQEVGLILPLNFGSEEDDIPEETLKLAERLHSLAEQL
ncbi:MAG: hypothetical protein ABIH35_00970 [Patescibacteria group bacterium]